MAAGPGVPPVSRLCQLAAGVAYEDVLGMPRIRRQQIAWKQINGLAALATLNYFDPQKVLCMSIFGPAQDAARAMEKPDFLLKLSP